ncbi:solute carrier family 45 member 4-like [Styela clava]
MESEGQDDDSSSLEKSKEIALLKEPTVKHCTKSSSGTKIRHIPEHRPWGQLWLHAALMCGRDFLYAIEVVLVTPIMLQLGMSESVYSYIWFCSPTVGLLLGPIMGSWSDRCTLKWGRRRPFILGFVVGTIIALTLLIFSRDLAMAITDHPPDQRTLGIVIGVLGTQVMDFCLDQLETPLRAFTLDVCSPADQQRAFTIQTLFMGLGGALGFIVDGIKWEDIFEYYVIGFQIKVVYIFAIIVYITTAAMTMLSIKEVQWEKRHTVGRSSSVKHKENSKVITNGALKSLSEPYVAVTNLKELGTKHGRSVDDRSRSPLLEEEDTVTPDLNKEVSVPKVLFSNVDGTFCENEVLENEESEIAGREEKIIGTAFMSPAVRSITLLPRVSLCKSVFLTMSCPEGLNDPASLSTATTTSLATEDDSSSDENDSSFLGKSHIDEDQYGSSMPNLSSGNDRHPATFLEILKNKIYAFSSNTDINNPGSEVDPKNYFNLTGEESMPEKNLIKNSNNEQNGKLYIVDAIENSCFKKEGDFPFKENNNDSCNNDGAVRRLNFDSKDNDDLLTSKKGERLRNREKRKKKVDEVTADDGEAKPVSFRKLWLSILTMPMKLRYLCFSLLSSFIGIEVLLLWYTNIFGSVVYKGDPVAPLNSTELKLYNDGVHMGCWGLTVYAVSMMIFSVTLEYFDILTRVSLRVVYAGGQLLTALSTAVMYMFPNKYVILMLSWTIGITVSTSLTIPYILVGKYHQEKDYVMKSPGATKRGYGTDCAILACQMYAGNLIYAAISGPIITSYGGVKIMLLVASICHAVAFFICVAMVTYPGERNFSFCKKERTDNVL